MDSVIYADKATEVSINKNTTDWNKNYTRCYKLKNLVVVTIAIHGKPANDKIIATGFPVPAGNRGLEFYIGLPTSIAVLYPDGTLRIASPGSSDTIYMGQTLAYTSIS